MAWIESNQPGRRPSLPNVPRTLPLRSILYTLPTLPTKITCVGPGVMHIDQVRPSRSHSCLNFPSVSNTCTRLFCRSATYRFEFRSITMLCGVLNCPGRVPRSPQYLIKLPSLENLATRELP